MAGIDSRRRRFLSRALRFLGGIAVLEAGWIAGSTLFARKRTAPFADDAELQVAGPVERFEHGSVTPFAEGKFYLVRLDDGGFLALHRKCTHLGCSVPWNSEELRFACPCHASAFDIRGDVINAPAPRPLDVFPVVIDDGIVKVDTTRVVRRSEFDPDQVVRA